MPYSLRLTINKADLARIRKQLQEAANIDVYHKALGRGLAEGLPGLINRTPIAKAGPGVVGRGTLRKGWAAGFRALGPLNFIVENIAQTKEGKRFALWVEDDTTPHEIRPRRAKFLAWQTGKGGGGRAIVRTISRLTGKALKKSKTEFFVFAKKVNHPGTTGQKFLFNSLGEFERRAVDAIMGTMRKIANSA